VPARGKKSLVDLILMNRYLPADVQDPL